MIGLERIQEWFKNGTSGNRPAAAYEITCACGQVSRGQRRARHQVVRCSGCRREMFVLPVSPLPPVLPPGSESSILQPEKVRSRPWMGPLIAGGVTLFFVIIGFAILFYYLLLAPAKLTNSARVSLPEIEGQVAEGRKSLAEANYAAAAESLAKAQASLAAQPQLFTPAERRIISQLHRQAAILADWPHEPLDKILARTATLNEDEWRVVAGSYKGKSAVLDLEIRRDASRQYHVNFTHPVAVGRLRLELHNLKLLEPLPLDAPQRVVFAARIADIRREDRGAYAVRFEPDSGVLLTDVSAGILGGIPEPAFRVIMEQQRNWVADLP